MNCNPVPLSLRRDRVNATTIIASIINANSTHLDTDTDSNKEPDHYWASHYRDMSANEYLSPLRQRYNNI